MASVVVEMSSDEARLYRGMQRIVDQQAKMEGGFGKVAKAAQDASKKTETGFGSIDFEGVAGGLQSIVTGLAAVGVSAQTAIRLMNDLAALREQSGKEQSASEFKLAELAQLAIGPTAKDRADKFAALKQQAYDLHQAGAGKTVDESAGMLFSMHSAGVADEIDTFKDLASTGVAGEIDVLARSAVTLIKTIGKEETGSARNLIGKGLIASGGAPTRVPELIEAAAKSGGVAKTLGISDEEVLAAVAQLATSTGKAGEGATQLSALLQSMDKLGMQGVPLADAVERISGLGKLSLEEQALLDSANAKTARATELKDLSRSRDLTKEERAELRRQGLTSEEKAISDQAGKTIYETLGSEEAVRGYRSLLGNLPSLRKTTAEIQAANSRDVVGEQLALVLNDEELTAARGERQSIANEEASRREKKLGTQANLVDTALKNRTAFERRMRGEGFQTEAGLWMRDQASGFGRWWQSDDKEFLAGHNGGELQRFVPGGGLDTAEKQQRYIQMDAEQRAQYLKETDPQMTEQTQVLREINHTLQRGAAGAMNRAANAQCGISHE